MLNMNLFLDFRRYTYSGIIHLSDSTLFDPVIVKPIGSPSFIINTLAREAMLSTPPRNAIKRLLYRLVRRLLIYLPNIFETDCQTCHRFFILAKAK